MGTMATEKTMQGEFSNKRTISTGWLVVLPAILFGLAWEPMPFTPLVFVAFAPLLLLAHRGRKMGGWRHFGLVFLSLLLWNITTTWWVWFASEVGAVAMLLMNSFFMYLPFGLWRLIVTGKQRNLS